MARSAKSAPITALFDYDSLDAGQRSIIQQRTGEIRERLRRSAQDVWEIGQKLSDVRSRLKYGQFLTWIKAEFGWSQRTAYNFINVYETFGDRFANLAKVNIATSLLYQLASPSVPEELREQILRAAEQGDTMTAKELQATIQKRRLKSAAIRKEKKQAESKAQKSSQKSGQKSAKEQPENIRRTADGVEVITVIAQSSDEASIEPSGGVGSQRAVMSPTDIASRARRGKGKKDSDSALIIHPGWYQLEGQHLVFCGDTATQVFAAWAPMAKLAIAVTGNDWAHDWLIDQAENVVVMPTAQYSNDKLKQLLKLLSKPGDVVMFPWLPDAKMLVTAHKLGRTVYAGEGNVVKCEAAIAMSKLRATPIEPNYVAELVG
ncbi:MAG: DUF3102 domain-containing protein [Cyanobacteria bacterium P01_D01_bin.105]